MVYRKDEKCIYLVPWQRADRQEHPHRKVCDFVGDLYFRSHAQNVVVVVKSFVMIIIKRNVFKKKRIPVCDCCACLFYLGERRAEECGRELGIIGTLTIGGREREFCTYT